MIRRPPRSTQSRSSAASDVYKRQRVHQQGQLAVEERRAAVALLRGGGIGGWRASHGRGHVGAPKLEAVAEPGRRGLAREPGSMERGEEEVARTVTREDAARSIATVRRRGQPDEDDAGRGIAPAGDGPRPVPLAAEPCRWVDRGR